MTQVGSGLYGSIKTAVIRIARLSAACAPVSGASEGAASKAIISMQAQAEYETGTEYTQKNGQGDLLISVKDEDKLKRLNLSLEMATRDFELISLMTGATLVTSGGTNYGIQRRGVGATAPQPVSMEIWTKVGQSAGTCAATASGQYFRHIYPKVTWTLGDTDLGDAVATVRMTGVAEGNPNWTSNGPFNDWYYGAIDGTTPEIWALDPVYSDPVTSIVPSSGTAGGFITVPAQ